MTRTTEARRTARTAQVARSPRTTPTPAEHDLLRDMAMVLKLTAKMSHDIRRDAAECRSAVTMN
jgi:hypothetical protein